ncbi:hypothetical protein JF544_16455 [Halobacillus kuroshimensis]|uniref:Uncharacterized protein n=1 Tax=Halobacillus kuroshimensis TaxID=302481 RepID=A0ABS3DZV8_9BACI|nr:hypothetical protein [Halobacillus kuroshimensis]MBN8236851.1 hypothetical protein [Halobacillus kuroshimensis]
MREDMECKHRQVETLVEENKRLKETLRKIYDTADSYEWYYYNENSPEKYVRDTAHHGLVEAR